MAEGFFKCVSHSAADDDFVSLVEHVFDYSNLIGNFGSSKDGYERTYWFINSFSKHVNFFFNQESKSVFRNIFRDAYSRSMSAVYRTECVFYEYVAEAGPVFAEFRIVLAFAWFIAGVLNEQDVAWFKGFNHVFEFFTAGYRAEFNFNFRHEFLKAGGYDT